MNSNKLYSFLSDRSQLATVNLAELEKLTEQFPYFQTAHLLYSMASKNSDASLFQKSIKKTAIVAVSRTNLYNLLYHNTIKKEELVDAEANKPQDITETRVIEMPPIIIQNEEITEQKEAETTIENVVEQKDKDLIEQVEREIQKDLIEAFVEKEILKTNDAHKKEEITKPKDANFGDWLHFLKKNNGQPIADIGEKKTEESEEIRYEDNEFKQKKQHRKGLIDKIIEENPGSIKLNKDSKFFVAEQKAKESLLENEHLVTETLAKIYALQGNINKAIRAYQILSLKYPNKSVYFASLIENLKKAN